MLTGTCSKLASCKLLSSPHSPDPKPRTRRSLAQCTGAARFNRGRTAGRAHEAPIRPPLERRPPRKRGLPPGGDVTSTPAPRGCTAGSPGAPGLAALRVCEPPCSLGSAPEASVRRAPACPRSTPPRPPPPSAVRSPVMRRARETSACPWPLCRCACAFTFIRASGTPAHRADCSLPYSKRIRLHQPCNLTIS